MKIKNQILNILTGFLAIIGLCAVVLVCFIIGYTQLKGNFQQKETYPSNLNENTGIAQLEKIEPSNQSVQTTNFSNQDTDSIIFEPKKGTADVFETEKETSDSPNISEAKNISEEPTNQPKTAPSNESVSQQNAVKSAKSYLNYSAFSYQGLVSQLEYEKFSNEDAVYAADNCGADWNEQALKSAKTYLDYSAFSRTGLIKQLEYEGFTNEQAIYGTDNCGADWNEQAVKSAKTYLDYSSFSRDSLIEQLEYEGFTNEQAVYGADSSGF